jgi:hypothetical protein
MGPTKFTDLLTVGCDIIYVFFVNIHARWGFTKLVSYTDSEEQGCDRNEMNYFT